ncbi:MAG: type II secretion system protein [Verrucomicrobiota bacterium]|jgi:type II secretory pathway pseudopilin PulG
MKPRLLPRSEAALTLFEVGVVIAILVVLPAVLLPTLAATKRKSSRVFCTNNLKQIGLAYRIWAGDNNDTYPMGVPVTNGGSMELVATGNVVQTFQVMSNELSTVRILICDGDSDHAGDVNRTYATNFYALSNSNVSYFVGVGVISDANPPMILSGDSDFESGGRPPKTGLLSLGTNDPVAWQPLWHGRSGNLGFNDGSVQTVNASGLHRYLVNGGFATNRLAIP